MTGAEYREGLERDAALAVGQSVTVYWGYGLGFRAHGPGKVVKVNRKSVQVVLTENVPDPVCDSYQWAAGLVLKGIPRFTNDLWQAGENCVEPVK